VARSIGRGRNVRLERANFLRGAVGRQSRATFRRLDDRISVTGTKPTKMDSQGA